MIDKIIKISYSNKILYLILTIITGYITKSNHLLSVLLTYVVFICFHNHNEGFLRHYDAPQSEQFRSIYFSSSFNFLNYAYLNLLFLVLIDTIEPKKKGQLSFFRYFTKWKSLNANRNFSRTYNVRASRSSQHLR